MILTRLVEFTDRLTELPPPGYQTAFVTKVIRLTADGKLRDVQSTAGQKRGKREGKHYQVPREQPQRTVGVVPRLIADNANYTLGKPREKDKPEQVEARHRSYCDLISECAAATGEHSVEAIRRWLSGGGAAALRDDPTLLDDDEFIFEVGDVFPTDLPSVRSFWANRGESGENAMCLVTGEFGPVVRRMPAPIKGIPDGQVSGTALISVNNAAGESYGLQFALNSPISKSAAEKIGNGLNYLLASERQRLRVGKAVYVFWTRSEIPFNPFSFLKDPKPEDVASLLKSPVVGSKPKEVMAPDFYILGLSANVSRVVIRDYHELTIRAVSENLANWFARLEVVGSDGTATPRFGIYRLAVSLFREERDMPAHVPTALITSAMTGALLPSYILGLAVKRNLAMRGPYAEYNRRRFLSTERMALIKAIITQSEDLNLDDVNAPRDAAFHCGRLLALLERIQREALGDINTTVVDRYYGAACATPSSVLGRLINDAHVHLSKLRKDKKDRFVQADLEQIITAIGAEFPKTLNLHRQGLFALGFYHQKAHERARIAEARANKEQGETK